MVEVAGLIARALRGRDDDGVLAAVRGEVAELCGRFDPYPGGAAMVG
jgi:glycine/serine hydroxymethyltransferase